MSYKYTTNRNRNMDPRIGQIATGTTLETIPPRIAASTAPNVPSSVTLAQKGSGAWHKPTIAKPIPNSQTACVTPSTITIAATESTRKNGSRYANGKKY